MPELGREQNEGVEDSMGMRRHQSGQAQRRKVGPSAESDPIMSQLSLGEPGRPLRAGK